MKVRAIKPGFHGKLREVDEEFDVADGRKASWYVPADKEPAAEKPKAESKAKGKAEAKGENSDDLV